MAKRTGLLQRENKIVSQTTRLYDRLYKLLGLSGEFNLVLYALFSEEGQTQKKIAAGYCIPPQTVNNVVRDMQRNGLVTLVENESDKRSKSIVFTEQGKEFAEKQIGVVIGVEKKAISRMGVEKFKRLIELQELYYASLQEEIINRAGRKK